MKEQIFRMNGDLDRLSSSEKVKAVKFLLNEKDYKFDTDEEGIVQITIIKNGKKQNFVDFIKESI